MDEDSPQANVTNAVDVVDVVVKTLHCPPHQLPVDEERGASSGVSLTFHGKWTKKAAAAGAEGSEF